jgi:hypothetical protein
VHSRVATFISKLPAHPTLTEIGQTVESSLEKFVDQIKNAMRLKTECLLLLGVSCRTSGGKSLARKEVTALQSKTSILKECDIHPTLLQAAKASLSEANDSPSATSMKK